MIILCYITECQPFMFTMTQAITLQLVVSLKAITADSWGWTDIKPQLPNIDTSTQIQPQAPKPNNHPAHAMYLNLYSPPQNNTQLKMTFQSFHHNATPT